MHLSHRHEEIVQPICGYINQLLIGWKISCFSCVILPIEIVYKSVNNGPTFTKLDSFVAKYVCYENQL